MVKVEQLNFMSGALNIVSRALNFMSGALNFTSGAFPFVSEPLICKHRVLLMVSQ